MMLPRRGRRFKFTDPLSGKVLRFTEFDTLTIEVNAEDYVYDVLTNKQIIKISKNVIDLYEKAFPKLPKDFAFEISVNINRKAGLYSD